MLMKKSFKKRYIKYTLKEIHMKKLTLSIPAIHCNHCAHTIKMELSDIEGVNTVEVDVDKKELMVAFEGPANEQAIKDLLTEINYPSED